MTSPTPTRPAAVPGWQPRRLSFTKEITIAIIVAVILFFIVPPLLLSGGQAFRLNLLGRFLALAIAALGIDLIWGYTGLLSLGNGIFFALGGYSLGMYLKLLDAQGGLPEFMPLYGVDKLPFFWEPFKSLPFTLIAIWAIPAILGGLFGWLVFRNRIRGVYFSILTQALTIVFFNLFNGQQKLINGTNGLTNFQAIFGWPLSSDDTMVKLYQLTVVFLLLAFLFCRWLVRGRLGQLLVSLRDDEYRLRFLGYNPTLFKVFVFAVAAGLAGIGGALYTPQTGIISPKAMDIGFSIEMVIWVAVGGRGTLIGAVLGALLVNFGKSLFSEQFPDFWLFLLGGTFIVVVLYFPEGFVGWWQQTAWPWLLRRLGRDRLSTYPSLEMDPEVTYDREHSGD